MEMITLLIRAGMMRVDSNSSKLDLIRISSARNSTHVLNKHILARVQLVLSSQATRFSSFTFSSSTQII